MEFGDFNTDMIGLVAVIVAAFFKISDVRTIASYIPSVVYVLVSSSFPSNPTQIAIILVYN
jgi:hypothetical protein